MSPSGVDASLSASLAAPQPAGAAPGTRLLAIRFTGSGSEYFRIWIVNLLLMVVTLSLYYPWARLRWLRYLCANTQVGGYPLGFHGSARSMLRGYLLVVLMFALYSVAGRFSALAGQVAFCLLVAIWPALVKASVQFRLANTSWRGLRFRFEGTLAEAYRTLLPLLVPGALLGAAAIAASDRIDDPQLGKLLVLGALLALVAVLPWLWWNVKKYQHDHYAYGPEQTRLRAGPGSFYRLSAKTLGIAVGALVLPALALFFTLAPPATDSQPAPASMVALSVATPLVLLLALQLALRPYATSRTQNLLWSRTSSNAVAFASALEFWPLCRLTLKNGLLIALTLGMYWPFATIATVRMRLEAVSTVLRIDPQTLSDGPRAGERDAAGDAAGELFGIDIGL